MADRLIGFICWGFFGCIVLMFIVSFLVWGIRRCNQEVDYLSKENEKTVDYQKNNRCIRATVIEQNCCAKVVGIKTPKAVNEFSVIFKTETGDIIKVNVPEEMYDGFDEGQTGILTLVNDEIYSFEIE